ncbi:hypothetical protein CVT25_011842 [Psilocybe cyanescens]|uniref:LysM domain-containing protein n=1 Tax=Psilocybe cyanescens TaxID=93625 RepID=A0A409WJ24_PSICY|nr:hypothetical protein CVT25_011842 [Psilocybe cyanescens]
MANFVFRSLAIAAIVCATLLVNAQVATPPCARNYTVQPGDFCDKISAQQNVSTFQLASVNSGKIDAACDNLTVGEVLCLGLVGEDCTNVHVVVAGDTCASIALQAGISTATVLANNPNVNADCSNIGIDEVLCVAPAPINSTASAS